MRRLHPQLKPCHGAPGGLPIRPDAGSVDTPRVAESQEMKTLMKKTGIVVAAVALSAVSVAPAFAGAGGGGAKGAAEHKAPSQECVNTANQTNTAGGVLAGVVLLPVNLAANVLSCDNIAIPIAVSVAGPATNGPITQS